VAPDEKSESSSQSYLVAPEEKSENLSQSYLMAPDEKSEKLSRQNESLISLASAFLYCGLGRGVHGGFPISEPTLGRIWAGHSGNKFPAKLLTLQSPGGLLRGGGGL